MQTLPSPQSGGAPPTQEPAAQVSAVVQASASSQGAVLWACWQPRTVSQESSVQTLPSPQSGGAPPTQEPAAQVSAVVQASASSHGATLLACWQPSTVSQESSVQTFPSPQSGGAPPTQAPAAQVSAVVQALASSHGAALWACWQPRTVSQESSVQTLPSPQSGGAPPTQEPAAQVSTVVQALASSHGAVLLVCWQPRTVSQESSVQTLPSPQSGGAPPTQAPAAQVSAVVQALASSHGAVLLVCWQPRTVSQESSVQTLPSPQSGGAPPTQAPAAQVSAVVQALASSHGAVLWACWQPRTVSQESSVQTLPSPQSGGAPPTQEPAAQVSAVVQASASSQGATLLACWQPSTVSQESSVQTLPSPQSGGAPPTQEPAAQVSTVVQALASSQGATLLACWQPSTVSQESSVQTLPSPQSGGAPPTQEPAAQVSTVVQALASSQGATLLACWQPSTVSQESSVQTLPSPQSGGAPPTQEPAAQVSAVVQALASSQGAVLLACWQPRTVSQESSVQTFPSPQSSGSPVQVPAEQTSSSVHTLPSSQARPSLTGCAWHVPVTGEHTPTLQASSRPEQSSGCPSHEPASQRSSSVQASPSSQGWASLAGSPTQAPVAVSQAPS